MLPTYSLLGSSKGEGNIGGLETDCNASPTTDSPHDLGHVA